MTNNKTNNTDQGLYKLIVNGNTYASLNYDEATDRRNIILSNYPIESEPNYDALVEFRSTSSAVLLPNLTNAIMEALTTPEPGMTIFNTDHDRLYTYTERHGWLPTGGRDNDLNPIFETITCTQSTSNLKDTNIDGILTANNLNVTGIIETGDLNVAGIIKADDLDIDDMEVNTIECAGNARFYHGIELPTPNLYTSTISASGALASNTNITLPANLPIAGQVLTAIDSSGNTEWSDFPIIGTFSGTATLNGINGRTINTVGVNANSIILVTRNLGTNVYDSSSVITIGNLIVGSVINNASFTVYSSVVNDVGIINWLIINP